MRLIFSGQDDPFQKLPLQIKARAEAGEEKKALALEFGVSRQTLYRILGREAKEEFV